MERVKTKTSGSDQSQWMFNTHNVLKWIQDFFESNLKKFFNKFFTNGGVFFYGSQAYLQCSDAQINGAKIDITINAGSGITDDGDMIILSSQIVDGTFNVQADASTYYVWLHHIIVDDTNSTYDVNRHPTSYSDVNVHELDSYEVKYANAWPTGQELTDSIKICQIDRAGSVLTVTDARVKAALFGLPIAAMDWLNTNYSAFDSTGTDNPTFGVDRLAYPPNGLAVLTESAEPAAPLNLRIYDINPHHGNISAPTVKVTFKWGWEKLQGQHETGDGTNTLRIDGVVAGDNMALDVAADELIGQRIYSPSFTSPSKTYLIEDNTATSGGETVLTLESAYADEALSSDGVIVPNADQLQFKLAPYYDGAEISEFSQVIELGDDFKFSPTYQTVLMMVFMDTNIDAYYNVYLRAKSSWDTFSAWHPMAAGSYDPDHSGGGQATVNYTAPFEVILPMLDDTGAGITLQPTPLGFQVTVTGWYKTGDFDQTAHQIQIGYTTLDTLSWSTATKVNLTGQWSALIPGGARRLYQVGARPIQNGQVVGTPILGQVVSGAGGVAPGDQPYFQQEIDIRTYDGSALRWDAGSSMYYIDGTDNFYTPSGQTSTVAWVHNFISYIQGRPGNILVDNGGDEYLIDGTDAHFDDQNLRGYFNLVQLSGGAALPADTGTGTSFSVNTTERGRRIFLANGLQIEFNGVAAFFDSDVIKGATISSKGVIRVCQNSTTGKSLADLLNVWQDDTGYDFAEDVDFTIRYSQGTMGLLVDAWDPSGTPNNTCCIRGRFTLYMRPHIARNTEEGDLNLL